MFAPKNHLAHDIRHGLVALAANERRILKALAEITAAVIDSRRAMARIEKAITEFERANHDTHT